VFLKAHARRKDGKAHRYYSLVESVRTARGPQHRTLAYIGELNASTEAAWRRSIEVLNKDGSARQLELFASDAANTLPSGENVVQVVLDRVRWERPRDFGEVWLARYLWRLLGLGALLEGTMPQGAEEVPWHEIAFVLATARMVEPSSELAVERNFYPRTALDDILGISAEKVNKDRLYRGLDELLPHKAACETHLKTRLGQLFKEPFDILLYDLTSTYFEGLAEQNPAAVRGYSRDHRSDCVQLVIGLVVTKSGLPIGYEVFSGNRADSTTLEDMVAKLDPYGGASRIWVFDRGVASEDNLDGLRAFGAKYLVGTPRTMLRKVEAELLEENWKQVREGIDVKQVAAPDGSEDAFILCRSADRRLKEKAMHQRFEKRMEEGLERMAKSIANGRLHSRDILRERLGRLKKECSRVARAYRIEVEGDGEKLAIRWSKDKAKAAYLERCEGAYLLRTNLRGESEQELWKMYMQLNDAEAAFRTLKQDLSIRPVFHQLEDRANAHVLVCFLAYAMYRTLDRLVRDKGLEMSGRQVLKTLATIKSGDVILPLVDGRELRLRRVSRPTKEQAELLAKLGLDLPERLGQDRLHEAGCSTDLADPPSGFRPLTPSIRA
jgi:transposase